ncbi:MAG: DinB family protein [Terracidiphilus sp.]
MPIPAIVATAAENYRFNSRFLKQTVGDLSPEEWLKRPSDDVNHIAWIVGHMAFCRGRVLHFMGAEWTRQGLEAFGRGKKLLEDSAYPTAESLLSAWSEAGHALATTFESVSEDLLLRSAPEEGPSSLDGKISGIVHFMAIHETYHLGQASYLRGWLGHKGLMG